MENKTILVGVNDVFFYTKLRDALKPQGYTLEKARTHGEVAEKAGALHPAAVVLNINHEEVDNWKRAQHLGVTKIVSRNEFSSRTLQLVQEVVGTGGVISA